MLKRAAAFCLGAIAAVFPCLAQTLRPATEPRPSYSQPGISNDGSHIAFVSAGDIWVVPSSGGEAGLLVADPANEERPLYSPDGKRIAFLSDREGSRDIWILTVGTGQITRLTAEDGDEQLDAWSRDGEWIYFSAGGDVYRVRSGGGTPMPVSADREIAEHMAAPAPDGKRMVVVARGTGESQWWRRGRSHADESELWSVVFDQPGDPIYALVSPRGAKQLWPMFAASGDTLYFVSDRSGEQNIWAKRGAEEARPLTSFSSGRVLWPSLSASGKIAFERDFSIWLYDPAVRGAREVSIGLRGAPQTDTVERLSVTGNFSDLAVSPDGRKIAVVARGEVFAASASDGGDAMRVTRTAAAESELRWSPDSRKLVYTANRTGAWQIYLFDFSTDSETALTHGDAHSNLPIFSPDGKSLAFIRGATELCVMDLATRAVRVVARGFFGRPPMMSDQPISWSPDNRWIAYLSAGARMFLNVWIVPAPGGEARQATWLSNVFAWPYSNTLSWSGDGRSLLFNTGTRTEPGDLVRIDLEPRTPGFREDLFANLFRDTLTESTPSTEVRVEFSGIRQRLNLVPAGLDAGAFVLSPDGKTVVLTARVGARQNLYSYSLDELAATPPVPRQLTATAGAKTNLQITADGKTVWYLDDGVPSSVTLDPAASKTLSLRAELDADFEQEKREVFHQTWEYLNENFYDPAFHGVDWKGVFASYAPRAAGARTSAELRRILNLMVGELDASHLGVFGPSSGRAAVSGRLGIDFDRSAYETRGEFRVAGVVPMGPAAVSGRLEAGDVIHEVDGATLSAHSNLGTILAHKINRKVTLTVTSGAAGNNRRTVYLRPLARSAEEKLRYRASILSRRALTSKLSNGRLGYVHIPDMGQTAPAELNLALDEENQLKEGLLIDVRNNSGGFTNGYILDMLMRRPYIDMAQRGAPAVSGRYVLGQRAVMAPTILITNQQTFSDGENFAEGYRVMGLGKVVGEPTAGADVFTGLVTLVDGTRVRLPYMRNSQLDQTALERAPRRVDHLVQRALGESYAGRDSQIEAAVRELLAQIDLSGSPRPVAARD